MARMRLVVDTYVERDVGMAYDAGVAAWSFDLDLWGICGQGVDDAGALEDLTTRISSMAAVTAEAVELVVVESIRGDEQAFAPDRVPCSDRERRRTIDLLTAARAETVELVKTCSAVELDHDDPDRTLP